MPRFSVRQVSDNCPLFTVRKPSDGKEIDIYQKTDGSYVTEEGNSAPDLNQSEIIGWFNQAEFAKQDNRTMLQIWLNIKRLQPKIIWQRVRRFLKI